MQLNRKQLEASKKAVNDSERAIACIETRLEKLRVQSLSTTLIEDPCHQLEANISDEKKQLKQLLAQQKSSSHQIKITTDRLVWYIMCDIADYW